jgi:MFS family permease
LLNNFVVERAAFTGVEIGILQSLREVPGFLAFTTVFVLLVVKEQTFALLSLVILGIGVALTGLLPFEYGFYFTTVLMSVGFHYFETVKQSLALQWLPKNEAPRILGKLIAVGSIASLATYALLWTLLEVANLGYVFNLLLSGIACALMALIILRVFPQFSTETHQRRTLVLRWRYWLYYVLIFFSGARRQIFVVFAAFLMVEKFHYSAAQVTLLFLINYAFNWAFAERIGTLIGRFGERRALTFEYIGLTLVFVGYAFVNDSTIAAFLYVVDHMFFALAIAIHTYFQKIADPKDIASTVGVSFTINHIAAITVPALLGLVWIHNPVVVFLIGAGFAICSLILSQNIPDKPGLENEVIWNIPQIFRGAGPQP